MSVASSKEWAKVSISWENSWSLEKKVPKLWNSVLENETCPKKTAYSQPSRNWEAKINDWLYPQHQSIIRKYRIQSAQGSYFDEENTIRPQIIERRKKFEQPQTNYLSQREIYRVWSFYRDGRGKRITL